MMIRLSKIQLVGNILFRVFPSVYEFVNTLKVSQDQFNERRSYGKAMVSPFYTRDWLKVNSSGHGMKKNSDR